MYQPDRPPQGPADVILNTASHLFYRCGITGVGVDTIVAQSGVSKATLYRHFSSRDQLVAAVLRRNDEIWRQNLVAGIERRASDPRDKLLAVFDWLEEWFADDGFRGCAFLNAAAELTANHPARDLPLEHKLAVRQLIADLARDAGLERPEDLADELVLLVDGAIAHALLEHSTAPARRAKRLAGLALSARRDCAGPRQATLSGTSGDRTESRST